MKARIIYDPNTSFLIKNPNLEKSRLALKAGLFTRESSLQPVHLAHDHNVQRYRSNTTNKCPTEIKLAQANQTRLEYGSIEWHDIKRSCFNPNCCAKYHWCPTCLLAPRCDCFMPHMTSTIGHDMRVIWSPDQFYYSSSLGRLTCDNRYGTFVQSVRSVAEDLGAVSSPFCLECTKSIRDCSAIIVRVSGRTYLEQASNLWKIISSIMCDQCINIIDGFPCMHLGTKCPSSYLKLICTRLMNYQPRQTIDKSKTHPHRRQNIRDSIFSGDPQPRVHDVTSASIRDAIRFNMKLDTSFLPDTKSDPGFSRTPGPQTNSRGLYPTADICTSDPPWMGVDIRNARCETLMHLWQSSEDIIPDSGTNDMV